jgi:hypothetical protein
MLNEAVLALFVMQAGRPRGLSSCPGRGKIFLLSTSSRPILETTQPHIQRLQGSISSRVKRPGREADHLLATLAEAKNISIYTSIPT